MLHHRCTNQKDAGTQVRVGGSEEEAAARLQEGARHLDVVMGEIRQQHLSGHTLNTLNYIHACNFHSGQKGQNQT